MSLVLKQWQANALSSSSPIIDEETYVLIKGREEGVISWLLSTVGVDPTITLTVTGKTIFFEQSSLGGLKRVVLPLSKVCSAYYGYSKPWKEALVIFVIVSTLLYNFVGPFWTFLVAAISAIAYYFLNKELTLGFYEDSGIGNGIAFKPSIIEGKSISEREALQVILILQELIGRKI